MKIGKNLKKLFTLVITVVMSASLSIAALAASNTHDVYNDYCLTKTEWKSGAWGNSEDVVNLVLNDNDNYEFSIIKRYSKWSNGGFLSFVRISDNKVMWQRKQHEANDWYYYTISGEDLLNYYHITDGDYRLAYGYHGDLMLYYSKIIRVTHANK